MWRPRRTHCGLALSVSAATEDTPWFVESHKPRADHMIGASSHRASFHASDTACISARLFNILSVAHVYMLVPSPLEHIRLHALSSPPLIVPSRLSCLKSVLMFQLLVYVFPSLCLLVIPVFPPFRHPAPPLFVHPPTQTPHTTHYHPVTTHPTILSHSPAHIAPHTAPPPPHPRAYPPLSPRAATAPCISVSGDPGLLWPTPLP
ncbi:hypothetical protein JTE90_007313 [Oedothorax gibbosus]|uniref:Uncharacterized protein n=1 Tax=Oedothorax gibbosus TaxID=931172 RepID=A0AAV6TEI0_9ARAC|nr:hypothetical protein JTE90_007313 [Oedothorax gibbosus]